MGLKLLTIFTSSLLIFFSYCVYEEIDTSSLLDEIITLKSKPVLLNGELYFKVFTPNDERKTNRMVSIVLLEKKDERKIWLAENVLIKNGLIKYGTMNYNCCSKICSTTYSSDMVFEPENKKRIKKFKFCIEPSELKLGEEYVLLINLLNSYHFEVTPLFFIYNPNNIEIIE